MEAKISAAGIKESYELAMDQYRTENKKGAAIIEQEMNLLPERIRMHVKEMVAMTLFDASRSCRFTARKLLRVMVAKGPTLPKGESEEICMATQKVALALSAAARKSGKKPGRRTLI